VWNAATNTPTLAQGVGTKGDTWRVGTAGTQLEIKFQVGEYIIFNGTAWEKSGVPDAVNSVAGLKGDIAAADLKTALTLSNVDNTRDNAKAVLSATKLTTARKLNGIAFDGTADVTIPVSTADAALYEKVASKAKANGYASLDANIRVPAAQLGTGTASNATYLRGDGAWAAVAAGEPTITAGTTAQYWRGDKTWQALNKAAVGLGSVDNTADAAKAVLSATKLTTARTINGIAFDGTANITVPVSSTDAALYEKVASKGKASGYAALDASTKIAAANLPFGTAVNTVMQGNDTRVVNAVQGSNAGTAAPLTLWVGTKAQFDAIATKSATTLYAVTGGAALVAEVVDAVNEKLGSATTPLVATPEEVSDGEAV
jgi:hypothetical protein